MHDQTHIESIAKAALRHHGLEATGWTFEWTNAKARCGDCHYARKRIRLSTIMLREPLGEAINTILHEVAHALAGPAAKHGPVWKAVCRKIGARPEQYNSTVKREVVWGTFCERCNKMTGGTIRRRSDRTLARRICRCGGTLIQKKIGQPIDAVSANR